MARAARPDAVNGRPNRLRRRQRRIGDPPAHTRRRKRHVASVWRCWALATGVTSTCRARAGAGRVVFAPKRRGLQPLPPLTAETRFPGHLPRLDGLDGRPRRCWSIQQLSSAARRRRWRAIPAAARPAYRHGWGVGCGLAGAADPLKLVRPKKAAADELVSRDTCADPGVDLWLDLVAGGLPFCRMPPAAAAPRWNIALSRCSACALLRT